MFAYLEEVQKTMKPPNFLCKCQLIQKVDFGPQKGKKELCSSLFPLPPHLQ